MKGHSIFLITLSLMSSYLQFQVVAAVQNLTTKELIVMQKQQLNKLGQEKNKLEKQKQTLEQKLKTDKKLSQEVQVKMKERIDVLNKTIKQLNHDYEFLKKTHEKYIQSQSPINKAEQDLSFAQRTMKELEPQTQKLEQQLKSIEDKIKTQSSILRLSEELNNTSQIPQAFRELSQAFMSLKDVKTGTNPVGAFFWYLEQCVEATKIDGTINLNNLQMAEIFKSKMDFYTLFFYTKIPQRRDGTQDIITFILTFLFIADNLNFHPVIINTLAKHCAVNIHTYLKQLKNLSILQPTKNGDLLNLPPNVQKFWPQLRDDLKEKIRTEYKILTNDQRWIDKQPVEKLTEEKKENISRLQRIWRWFKSLPKTIQEKIWQRLPKKIS